jgi:hypothetical protein
MAMEHVNLWPWLVLAALGAFHGLNPGMGWLFAVALGMQEKKRAAVWRALPPLAAGHLLAVGAAILIAALADVAVSPRIVRWPVAVLLIGLGIRRFFRHCHARGIGMRAGMGGLTWWSFLMATAHGAGLMVLPVFLGMTTHAAASYPSCHAHAPSGSAATAFAATFVHGAGYLVVTAAAAWFVFEKVGVGLLRRAWFNLDLLWAGALVITGALTLAL